MPSVAASSLPSSARSMNPATVVALEADLRAAWQPDAEWDGAVDDFFDLARLRHEMTLSFQEPA